LSQLIDRLKDIFALEPANYAAERVSQPADIIVERNVRGTSRGRWEEMVGKRRHVLACYTFATGWKRSWSVQRYTS
jgi:hypothetical protein